MDKDFSNWHRLKATIHSTHSAPTFKQREVWWCSIGVNVGHESDGKSRFFNRPVLVLRKFNVHMFWGVPLTTKIKDSFFYHRIHFKDREQCVMLSQLRLWDSRRLTDKIGQLTSEQFHDVRKALKGLL